MRLPITLLVCVLTWPALGQALWRNYWTTNQVPVTGTMAAGQIPVATSAGSVAWSDDAYVNLNSGRGFLRDFDANVTKANSTPTVIAFIGDSWMAKQLWTPEAIAFLQNRYGFGGAGFVWANTNSSQGLLPTGITQTRAGTWTSVAPSGGGLGPSLSHVYSIDIATPASLIYTGMANTVTIHYIKQPTGGTFTFAANGGAATTVDTADAATSVATTNITGLANNTLHWIKVTVATAGTAGVGICGFEFKYTKTDGSVIPANIAYTGTTAANWSGANETIWTNALANLNPNLVVVSLGMNDYTASTPVADYRNSLITVVGRIQRVLTNASIVLVSQCDPGTNTSPGPTFKQYVDALRGVAFSQSCGWVDNYKLIGPYANANGRGLYANYNHINTTGGNLLAEHFANFLFQKEGLVTDKLTTIQRPEVWSIFGGQYPTSLTTGYKNTGFGRLAATSLTTGYQNAFFGEAAGYAIKGGYDNTAVGAMALYTSQSGSDNVFAGTESGYAVTSGSSNVGLGKRALYSATTGSYFTAVGYHALYNANGAVAGGRGVALGFCAGKYDTGGTNFYVNAWDQTSSANDKSYSLLYGTFANASASTTGQQLTVNGALTAATTMTATNAYLIPTNYVAANFAPSAGFIKIVASNNVIYAVSSAKTNVLSDLQ